MIKADQSAAVLHPSRCKNHTLNDGSLSVFCWCRRHIVYVAPAVIAAHSTGSCGLSDCHPPAGAT